MLLLVLAVVCLFVVPPGRAQTPLTLEQAQSRRLPHYAPAYSGEVVLVHGWVAAEAVNLLHYAHLGIQDDAGYGLMLEGALARLSMLKPGDRVEACGTLSERAGLPVLTVSDLNIIARGPAPAPKWVELDGLQSFRNLGVLVTTDGQVVGHGENTGGEYLLIGDERRPLKVFLPHRVRGSHPVMERFEVGDKVRVTGIASQYCPAPPFNRLFQVLIPASDAVVLLEKRWLVSPELFLSVMVALGLAIVVAWIRDRRMTAHRNLTRTLYALGEETISASSPPDILKKLLAVLPKLLRISGVRLYLYNRSSKTLDPVDPNGESRMMPIPVQPDGKSPISGASACFRNRVLLAIRDTRRSPFFENGQEGAPRSVMYLPMHAQSELVGVFEVHDQTHRHRFSADEQVAAQHLANQIAMSLRLMDQHSIREQLFRSEKMAAAGQLISGVAADLGPPLESIRDLAEKAIGGRSLRFPESTLREISAAARKAEETVARLVSFTRSDIRSEGGEAKPVDVNALLRNLIEFRRPEWSLRGIEVREFVSSDPVFVLGSHGQLERVFLDLLVQAEQVLANAPQKMLTIGTSVLGKRFMVEILHRAVPSQHGGGDCNPLAGMPGEGVYRGIIRSYGGEVRVVSGADGECRLEIEFPLAPPTPTPGATATVHPGTVTALYTVLVVEPDPAVRQSLVTLLSARACRVVPTSSAEQSLELIQRLRFDLVFCAVRLPGLNWIEFCEQVRNQTKSFVLLTEGFDTEASRYFPDGEGWVLSKPVQEADLDRLLDRLEGRTAVPPQPATK
jgi:CheY-like chemotaxis protein